MSSDILRSPAENLIRLEENIVTTRLISDEILNQVKDIFAELEKPVEVLFFGQKEECTYCPDTHQLLEEVTSVSDKLELSVFDLDADREMAQQFGVDKAPGMAFVGKDGNQRSDYGVRYAGIPSGHEFSSLIHDLIRVSKRDSGLSQGARQALKDLREPVHLMVFVTPTCPYCPQAVVLAHQLAMESPYIEAEMIEATEFSDLSRRYGVSGVPQTTINYGAATVVGAVPEEHLVSEIIRAMKK